MSDYLAYWKEYWNDTEETRQMFTEEWHTKSKRFYRQVKPDDNLWIVATGGRDCPNEWRLLQRLHIGQVQLDSAHERPYHLLGDVEENAKFKIGAQFDFTPILHKLDFASGKRITAKGKLIGQALEKIRKLSDEDVALLELCSKGLKRFERPRWANVEQMPLDHATRVAFWYCWLA